MKKIISMFILLFILFEIKRNCFLYNPNLIKIYINIIKVFILTIAISGIGDCYYEYKKYMKIK